MVVSGPLVGPEEGCFFSYFTPDPAPLCNLLEGSLLVHILCPHSFSLIGFLSLSPPSSNPICLQLPSLVTSALKMETSRFSEMLASTYKTTQCQNPRQHQHFVVLFTITAKAHMYALSCAYLQDS
jgi:hypothetical protein